MTEQPTTEAGQLLDLLWPGTTLNRSEWRDRILAIEAAARQQDGSALRSALDEEDIIDRAVPSVAKFGQVPRTEVIRSIVRAIHEQGAALAALPPENNSLRAALKRLLDWREFYTDAEWRQKHDLADSDPWNNARALLAALPPSAPPALDVDVLRDALIEADRSIGVPIASDAQIDHYTAMAIQVTAEYARLQEQDR